MARDYQRRAQRKPERKPVPVFVWLLIGYLLGAVSVGLLWLNWTPQGEPPGWVNQTPPLAVDTDTESRDAVPVSPPKFDFYEILPKMEVEVPDEEPEPRRPVAKEMPVEKPPAGTHGPRYLLQVGSFRNPADADSARARLTLLGYPTSLSRVKTADGRSWTRVRVGPIESGAELRAQRKQLEKQGYKPLAIRIKP